MDRFPNKAGDHPDTDSILAEELHAAGIGVLGDEDGQELTPGIKALIRNGSGEVKTSTFGTLHGWEFRRNWKYWVCKGPGIELTAAEKLYKTHGKEVRLGGLSGDTSPLDLYNGLACGFYHVDTPGGLKALANTIKEIVELARLKSETEE